MAAALSGFLTRRTWRRPWLQQSVGLIGAAVLAATLVACGGGSGDLEGEAPVDALASFKQQTLDWQACDPWAMDSGYMVLMLEERAQCALMRVPRDYANPSSAELQIEVLRVTAEQPEQRLGAIVLNPGGPGEDGLELAVNTALRLSDPDASELSALRDMSRSFDLIGFSPRGTGRHSPLECTPSEDWAATHSLGDDPSPENFANIQRNVRVYAKACNANPLTSHIHTDATARDMDLLRGLLGEDKLNYIGYSYGTWLGSWYAGLFPERVGRMLFDSSMSITRSFEATNLLDGPAGQRLVDEVILPHAARRPDRFGLGNDAAALRQRLLAVSAPLRQALTHVWFPDSHAQLDRNVFAVSAALHLQDWLTQNPQASQHDVQMEIATSPAFTDRRIAVQARLLSARLFGPVPINTAHHQNHVFWAISCNDSPAPATADSYQSWSEQARDFDMRYPLVRNQFGHDPCFYLQGARQTMPPAADVGKAGPSLMLQSRYDVQTPIEGAQETWNALPNAHLIVVENEYLHGVFPYGTACVDQQVAGYFLHGQLPARISSCAGKPLGSALYEPYPEEDA